MKVLRLEAENVKRLKAIEIVPNGPAVIVERETSTVITTPVDAVIQSDGAILLVRKGSQA